MRVKMLTQMTANLSKLPLAIRLALRVRPATWLPVLVVPWGPRQANPLKWTSPLLDRDR